MLGRPRLLFNGLITLLSVVSCAISETEIVSRRMQVFDPVHEGDFRADAVVQKTRPQAESAALALESLIASRGLAAAVAEYKRVIAGNQRYAVVEKELNALGYRYLRNERTAEAIAVFEINAAAFPQSWNVWDSLAHANLAARDMQKAETFYAKSVALNPENQNGKDRLKELRGYKLDQAGETQVPLRFQPGTKTGLRTAYFGEEPPGTKPKLFAPGIVASAGAFEFAVTFSPDGREIYFTRRTEGAQNTIMVSRWEKEGWTAPEEAVFARGYPSNEPHITPDGRKLYFGSRRTRPGAERPEYAIWVVERNAGGGWSEPRFHGPGMYVTAARNGNLYMTDVTNVVSPQRGVIVYPWAADRYEPPRLIGGGVNTPVVADHAFVSPDESYILFDSSLRPGSQGGDGDLYVSFRKPDGSWSLGLNLGDDINTAGTDFCPSVSPDGKYIFYSMKRDIYWVSAEILTTLKSEDRGSETLPGGSGRPQG